VVEGSVVGAPERGNIAQHLPHRARITPFQRAIVEPRGRADDGRVLYAQATFAQLDQLCDRMAHGLADLGVERGDRALILVPPGIEMVAVTFALFKLGAVAVFIDPGMGVKALARSAATVQARAFLGVSKAHLGLKLLGRQALRGVKHRVVVGGGMRWGGTRLSDLMARAPSSPFECAPVGDDTTAAILFTSGSTGPAKGVVYAHRMFQAQTRLLREVYGLGEGDVDLPGLPVFSLFTVALGATVVFPDMDSARPASLDPARWVEGILDQGVTYSFGSPAIWGPVTRYCVEQGVQLPSLKQVFMAGAPVPPWVHEQLRGVLAEGGSTHTPYGATEGLPVATYSGTALAPTFAKTRAGKGTCVGTPVSGMEVRIIEVRDEDLPTWSDGLVLPTGEVGEIVVTGPVVTEQYWELPEATARAKIREARGDGERVWHRMGDVGYLDELGRLWFCGRKAHRVVTLDRTHYSVCCEAIFNEHPKVKRTALVGPGPRGAQLPVLVVELAPEHVGLGQYELGELVAQLKQLGAKHEHTKAIQTILFHPAFPVDVRHNAKIRREELTVWAAKRLPPPAVSGD
jgi:olefin beta-lactone synthetase